MIGSGEQRRTGAICEAVLHSLCAKLMRAHTNWNTESAARRSRWNLKSVDKVPRGSLEALLALASIIRSSNGRRLVFSFSVLFGSRARSKSSAKLSRSLARIPDVTSWRAPQRGPASTSSRCFRCFVLVQRGISCHCLWCPGRMEPGALVEKSCTKGFKSISKVQPS